MSCSPNPHGELASGGESWRRPPPTLRLPVAERIELVQAIWDSVVAESSAVPVTDEQRIELDRRLAAAEANPSDERPWSEVRASLEGLKPGGGTGRPFF